MKKFEFQRKLQDGEELLAEGRFEEAVAIFDELDLSLIDQPRRLQNIARAYERCKRYEDAEDILLDAREFAPKSRATTFHLCTVALKAGELREAKEYYRDFLKIGARDPQRFVLQYRIAEAEGRPDEELISILETFRKEEPDDRWMFQLANLYAKHGENEKAVAVCNDIDMWFFNGKYVKMARELRERLGSDAPDYSKEIRELQEEEEKEREQEKPPVSVSPYAQTAVEEETKETELSPFFTGRTETPEETAEVPEEDAEEETAVPEEAPEEEEAAEAPAVTAAVYEEPVRTPAEEPAVSEEETAQPVFTVRPAKIEEEDLMFDFSYSSAEARTVEDEDFEEPFVPVMKTPAEEPEETPAAEIPQEEEVTIPHFVLPKDEPKPGFGIDDEEEEDEEELPAQEEDDEHVVFKVTNSATVAARAEEKAVEAAEEAAEAAGKDIFHFDFDVDGFEFDDDDEDEEDREEKTEEQPAEEKVTAKPAPADDDDEDDDDEDDEDDEDEEDVKPAKKGGLFGFFARKPRRHEEEEDFDEEDDEDDEEEGAPAKAVKAEQEAEEKAEPEEKPDFETLALQAAIRRKEEDSRLLGGLPIDPDVDQSVWHFMVYGKTPELSLECAREKLRELMDVNPNCPSKMLKISAEKIGSANIINSLDRFLNNMVIVEGAGKLTDQQLSDFAKVLNKDDRALLLVFTDTKEELIRMFEREPGLKDSFTAVYEGKRFTASDLMEIVKAYLYTEDAKMTSGAEDYLSEYITNLLAEGKGFYRTNVKALASDALQYAEKGGFLGLAMGKVDEDGYLLLAEKHFRKAENAG